MKQAAGEANLTIITIALIAVVLAFGTIIVGNLMKNTSKKVDSNDCPVGYRADANGNCVRS